MYLHYVNQTPINNFFASVKWK